VAISTLKKMISAPGFVLKTHNPVRAASQIADVWMRKHVLRSAAVEQQLA